MYSLLNSINTPNDLRKLTPLDLPILASEVRKFIIEIVAEKGGHLGASLGVVELTLALHYYYNTPIDKLVWDVGHQAYCHKIITGRKENFYTNRTWKGISGFPKMQESEYDCFGTGHSSTSISAVLGMAISAKLAGDYSKNHIAVIGDASIAAGMAFEAMNHAGVTAVNMLIILNDNAIGIDPSIGALKNYFTSIKNNENTIFQSLNLYYKGIIDGHNIEELLQAFEELKLIPGPKLLHISTTKGKGLLEAEKDQVTYHAPGKFDILTGKLNHQDTSNLAPKFQDVFGETLLELALQNKKIIGITPAMPTGSSMKLMIDAIPERAFDVGIAEQHAVTLAAGMASMGNIVYCNIYSTFIQRAYDQVIHDVALQNLPVIFCLDRAGLVGEDGATHHGVYDLAFMSCIPNLDIFAPIDEIELRNILYSAQLGLKNPLVIRYPRGRGVHLQWKNEFQIIENKSKLISEGSKFTIISTGFIGQNVMLALSKSTNKHLFSHYHFGYVHPLDENSLHQIFKKYKKIITIEEGTIKGGFGSSILEFSTQNNYQKNIEILGIPHEFIEHGSIEDLHKYCKIDADSLLKKFEEYI
ncbi:MAG: 1-deoxy-D-xylulose-5-phosphate synthase [Flavobacterium sp.]